MTLLAHFQGHHLSGCYVTLGALYGLSWHYCLMNLKRECMCLILGTAPHKEATVQTWNSPAGQTGGRPSSLHGWERPTRLWLCSCMSTRFIADLQRFLTSTLASVCLSRYLFLLLSFYPTFFPVFLFPFKIHSLFHILFYLFIIYFSSLFNFLLFDCLFSFFSSSCPRFFFIFTF